MTIDKCIKYAQGRGYTYAALQYSSQCVPRPLSMQVVLLWAWTVVS